jgi:hypothetical protein
MTMATMDLIGEEDGRQRRRDNSRRVRGRGLGTCEGRGCFRAWRREAERVAHEGREREEEGQTIRVGGGKNGGIGEEADGGGGRARVEGLRGKWRNQVDGRGLKRILGNFDL